MPDIHNTATIKASYGGLQHIDDRISTDSIKHLIVVMPCDGPLLTAVFHININTMSLKRVIIYLLSALTGIYRSG